MLSANKIAGFSNQIYLEENDETAWSFKCGYKFMKVKSWLK